MGKIFNRLAGVLCAAAIWATPGTAGAAIVIDSFNLPAGGSTASTSSELTAVERADGLGFGTARSMVFSTGNDPAPGARSHLTRDDGYVDVQGTGGARASLLLRYTADYDQSLNLETNPIFSIDLTQFTGAAPTNGSYALETLMIATLRTGQSYASRNFGAYTTFGPRTLYYHFHLDGVADPVPLTDVTGITLILASTPNSHLRLSNFVLTDLTSIPAAVPEPASAGVVLAGAAVMFLRRRRRQDETVGNS